MLPRVTIRYARVGLKKFMRVLTAGRVFRACVWVDLDDLSPFGLVVTPALPRACAPGRQSGAASRLVC